MASSVFQALGGFVAALMDALRIEPTLTGVQIEPGWPGDQLDVEVVWVDAVQFTAEIPVCTGTPSATNPLWRDAHAQLPININANTAGQDADTAYARVCEIAGTVESVLAADPNLASTDGVFQATLILGSVQVTRTDNGVLGYDRIVLDLFLRASEAP